ncbi:MAG: hypothetical protein Q9190_002306 [Brigantiaea leucoxantha]
MSRSIGEPRQHTQPSRKGKKAWRKHVDVSEIQEGLENVREEVIKGGVIAEKPSDALFTLDTTGSESIKKSYLRAHKPLKADQILALRSAVPSIDTHKRAGSSSGAAEPSSKKRKTNGVSAKEYERLRKIAYGGESFHKDVASTNITPNHDPWALESRQNEEDQQFSYLERPKAIKVPSTLNRPPVSLIASNKALPAIPKPAPGKSYNPMFQDWDHLLTSEGVKEVEAEKKRLEEQQAELQKQELIAAAQDEKDEWLTQDESAWEGFESDYENADSLAKKRPERKTQAERNRIKRKKAAERQAKHDANTKEKEKQARQISNIAKQVEAEAETKNNSSALVLKSDDSESERSEDQTLRRRKFGNYRLPNRDLELVLPEELQDSLRLLKPEGNLLKDRYRNMLLRGKMETRRPISQPKKKRRTETEKWTYKDFQIPAGA